jgi:DNA-binding transcriptional ArsR family regulator
MPFAGVFQTLEKLRGDQPASDNTPTKHPLLLLNPHTPSNSRLKDTAILSKEKDVNRGQKTILSKVWFRRKMKERQPTLWRTCRVLANESRLTLLYLLLDYHELCNRDLANITGLSEPQVSIHLRLLNSRGLIRQHRRKMNLLSSPQANLEIEAADLLMRALTECHSRAIPVQNLFRQVTAFTHARRIELVQHIPPTGIQKEVLSETTGIALSSVNRHLKKLKARNFVTDNKRIVSTTIPNDPLSKTLLQLVVRA